ncbi:MAG: hypothetical protein U0R44_04435 [Candidatus Micrarchaeia archaeon]
MAQKTMDTPGSSHPQFGGLDLTPDRLAASKANIGSVDASTRVMLDRFSSAAGSLGTSLPDAAGIRSRVEAIVPENMRSTHGRELATIEDIALRREGHIKSGDMAAAERDGADLRMAIIGLGRTIRGEMILEASGAPQGTIDMFRNNFWNFAGLSDDPTERAAHLSLGRATLNAVEHIADHPEALSADPTLAARVEKEVLTMSSHPLGNTDEANAHVEAHAGRMDGINRQTSAVESAISGGSPETATVLAFQGMVSALMMSAMQESAKEQLGKLKDDLEALEKKLEEEKKKKEETGKEDKEETKEKIDYVKNALKILKDKTGEEARESVAVFARGLAALSLAHNIAAMERHVSNTDPAKRLSAEEAAMRVLGIKDKNDPRVKGLIDSFGKAGATKEKRAEAVKSLIETAKLQQTILARHSEAKGELRKKLDEISKDLSERKKTVAQAVSAVGAEYQKKAAEAAAGFKDSILKAKAEAIAKMFKDKPPATIAELEKMTFASELVGKIFDSEGKLAGKAKEIKDGAMKIFGRALDCVLRGGGMDTAVKQYELGKKYAEKGGDKEVAGALEKMSSNLEDGMNLRNMEWLVGRGFSVEEAAMRALGIKDRNDPRVKALAESFRNAGKGKEEREKKADKLEEGKPYHTPLPKMQPPSKGPGFKLAPAPEEKKAAPEAPKAPAAVPKGPAVTPPTVVPTGPVAKPKEPAVKPTAPKPAAVEAKAPAADELKLAAEIVSGLKKILLDKTLPKEIKDGIEAALKPLEAPGKATKEAIEKGMTILGFVGKVRKDILSGIKEPALSETAAIFDKGMEGYLKDWDKGAMNSIAVLALRFSKGTPEQKNEIKQVIAVISKKPELAEVIARGYLILEGNLIKLTKAHKSMGEKAPGKAELGWLIGELKKEKDRLVKGEDRISKEDIAASEAKIKKQMAEDPEFKGAVEKYLKEKKLTIADLAAREELSRVKAMEKLVKSYSEMLNPAAPKDQKEAVLEMLGSSARRIMSGDLENGMIFQNIAEIYLSVKKEDRERVLAIARVGEANSKLPGIPVFNDPDLLVLSIYKERTELEAKITNPAMKTNAQAYFDLAIRTAGSGLKKEAKIIFDMAAMYAKDAAMDEGKLSPEGASERTKRMVRAERYLGEYSANNTLGGKRILDIGPKGWKPPEGAIDAPLAKAILAGGSVTEALGKEKRAETEASLKKELGREPTKAELEDAVEAAGIKSAVKLGHELTRDSFLQEKAAGDSKGIAILGAEKDREAMKKKYASEGSDFVSMTSSVGRAAALREKGTSELLMSVDLEEEYEAADDAGPAFVRKRTDELSSGLPPEMKEKVDLALKKADSLGKEGKAKEADELRNALYKSLLDQEITSLIASGNDKRLSADAAADSLAKLHKSVTRIDTINKKSGRAELDAAAKTFLAIGEGHDADEKGEKLIGADSKPVPLTAERKKKLVERGIGLNAAGSELVSREEKIKKQRDGAIWLEQEAFKKDIGRVQSVLTKLLVRDMIANFPKETYLREGQKPMKEVFSERYAEAGEDQGKLKALYNDLVSYHGKGDRLAAAGDDPAKLQKLYEDLTGSQGVKTTDERGEKWLDLNGYKTKHSTVISLNWSERFADAETYSAKVHTNFDIRFQGAKMHLDEYDIKKGYADNGIKFFAGGDRGTIGNPELGVLVGLIPDPNSRYRYEKELAMIPPGKDGLGAREKLLSRLMLESIPVPGAGAYEKGSIKDVVEKGRLPYFNTSFYGKRLMALSDAAEAGDVIGARKGFRTLESDMFKAKMAEGYGIKAATSDFNKWKARDEKAGVDGAFLEKAPYGVVEKDDAVKLRDERNKALKSPLDKLGASYERSEKDWEGTASANHKAVDSILAGEKNPPVLEAADKKYRETVGKEKERTAAREFAKAFIEKGKRFMLKGDLSEFGRLEKAEDFAEIAKEYEKRTGMKLPYFKLEYDTSTAAREMSAICLEDAMTALDNDETFLTALKTNKEVTATVYEHTTGDFKTGPQKSTYISVYSAVDEHGRRVPRKINFGKEVMSVSRSEMLLTSSYMFGDAKEGNKEDIEKAGKDAGHIFFWRVGLDAKETVDGLRFESLERLSPDQRERLMKAAQNFDMLLDNVLVPTVEGYDISIGFGTKTPSVAGTGVQTEKEFVAVVLGRMILSKKAGDLAIAGDISGSDATLKSSGMVSFTDKGEISDSDAKTKGLKSEMGDIGARYAFGKAAGTFAGDMILGAATGGAYFVVTGVKGVAEAYEEAERSGKWSTELYIRAGLSAVGAVVPIGHRIAALKGLTFLAAAEAPAGGLAKAGYYAYKGATWGLEKSMFYGGAGEFLVFQAPKIYDAYKKGEMGWQGLVFTGMSGASTSVLLPWAQARVSKRMALSVHEGGVPKYSSRASQFTQILFGFRSEFMSVEEHAAAKELAGFRKSMGGAGESYAKVMSGKNPIEVRAGISEMSKAAEGLPPESKKLMLDLEAGHLSKMMTAGEMPHLLYSSARNEGKGPAEAFKEATAPSPDFVIRYTEARSKGKSPEAAFSEAKSPAKTFVKGEALSKLKEALAKKKAGGVTKPEAAVAEAPKPEAVEKIAPSETEARTKSLTDAYNEYSKSGKVPPEFSGKAEFFKVIKASELSPADLSYELGMEAARDVKSGGPKIEPVKQTIEAKPVLSTGEKALDEVGKNAIEKLVGEGVSPETAAKAVEGQKAAAKAYAEMAKGNKPPATELDEQFTAAIKEEAAKQGAPLEKAAFELIGEMTKEAISLKLKASKNPVDIAASEFAKGRAESEGREPADEDYLAGALLKKGIGKPENLAKALDALEKKGKYDIGLRLSAIANSEALSKLAPEPSKAPELKAKIEKAALENEDVWELTNKISDALHGAGIELEAGSATTRAIGLLTSDLASMIGKGEITFANQKIPAGSKVKKVRFIFAAQGAFEITVETPGKEKVAFIAKAQDLSAEKLGSTLAEKHAGIAAPEVITGHGGKELSLFDRGRRARFGIMQHMGYHEGDAKAGGKIIHEKTESAMAIEQFSKFVEANPALKKMRAENPELFWKLVMKEYGYTQTGLMSVGFSDGHHGNIWAMTRRVSKEDAAHLEKLGHLVVSDEKGAMVLRFGRIDTDSGAAFLAKESGGKLDFGELHESYGTELRGTMDVLLQMQLTDLGPSGKTYKTLFTESFSSIKEGAKAWHEEIGKSPGFVDGVEKALTSNAGTPIGIGLNAKLTMGQKAALAKRREAFLKGEEAPAEAAAELHDVDEMFRIEGKNFINGKKNVPMDTDGRTILTADAATVFKELYKTNSEDPGGFAAKTWDSIRMEMAATIPGMETAPVAAPVAIEPTLKSGIKPGGVEPGTAKPIEPAPMKEPSPAAKYPEPVPSAKPKTPSEMLFERSNKLTDQASILRAEGKHAEADAVESDIVALRKAAKKLEGRTDPASWTEAEGISSKAVPKPKEPPPAMEKISEYKKNIEGVDSDGIAAARLEIESGSPKLTDLLKVAEGSLRMRGDISMSEAEARLAEWAKTGDPRSSSVEAIRKNGLVKNVFESADPVTRAVIADFLLKAAPGESVSTSIGKAYSHLLAGGTAEGLAEFSGSIFTKPSGKFIIDSIRATDPYLAWKLDHMILENNPMMKLRMAMEWFRGAKELGHLKKIDEAKAALPPGEEFGAIAAYTKKNGQDPALMKEIYGEGGSEGRLNVLDAFGIDISSFRKDRDGIIELKRWVEHTEGQVAGMADGDPKKAELADKVGPHRIRLESETFEYDSKVKVFLDLIVRGGLPARIAAIPGFGGKKISSVEPLSGLRGIFKVKMSDGRSIFVKPEDMLPVKFGEELAASKGLVPPETLHGYAYDTGLMVDGKPLMQDYGISLDIHDLASPKTGHSETTITLPDGSLVKAYEGKKVMASLPSDGKTENVTVLGVAMFRDEVLKKPDADNAAAAMFYKLAQTKEGREKIFKAWNTYHELSRRILLMDRFDRNTTVMLVRRASGEVELTFQPIDMDGIGARIGSKEGKPDFTDFNRDFADATSGMLIDMASALDKAASIKMGNGKDLFQGEVPAAKAMMAELLGEKAGLDLKADKLAPSDLKSPVKPIVEAHEGKPFGLGFDTTSPNAPKVGSLFIHGGRVRTVERVDGRVHLYGDEILALMDAARRDQAEYVEGLKGAVERRIKETAKTPIGTEEDKTPVMAKKVATPAGLPLAAGAEEFTAKPPKKQPEATPALGKKKALAVEPPVPAEEAKTPLAKKPAPPPEEVVEKTAPAKKAPPVPVPESASVEELAKKAPIPTGFEKTEPAAPPKMAPEETPAEALVKAGGWKGRMHNGLPLLSGEEYDQLFAIKSEKGLAKTFDFQGYAETAEGIRYFDRLTTNDPRGIHVGTDGVMSYDMPFGAKSMKEIGEYDIHVKIPAGIQKNEGVVVAYDRVIPIHEYLKTHTGDVSPKEANEDATKTQKEEHFVVIRLPGKVIPGTRDLVRQLHLDIIWYLGKKRPVSGLNDFINERWEELRYGPAEGTVAGKGGAAKTGKLPAPKIAEPAALPPPPGGEGPEPAATGKGFKPKEISETPMVVTEEDLITPVVPPKEKSAGPKEISKTPMAVKESELITEPSAYADELLAAPDTVLPPGMVFAGKSKIMTSMSEKIDAFEFDITVGDKSERVGIPARKSPRVRMLEGIEDLVGGGMTKDRVGKIAGTLEHFVENLKAGFTLAEVTKDYPEYRDAVKKIAEKLDHGGNAVKEETLRQSRVIYYERELEIKRHAIEDAARVKGLAEEFDKLGKAAITGFMVVSSDYFEMLIIKDQHPDWTTIEIATEHLRLSRSGMKPKLPAPKPVEKESPDVAYSRLVESEFKAQSRFKSIDSFRADLESSVPEDLLTIGHSFKDVKKMAELEKALMDFATKHTAKKLSKAQLQLIINKNAGIFGVESVAIDKQIPITEGFGVSPLEHVVERVFLSTDAIVSHYPDKSRVYLWRDGAAFMVVDGTIASRKGHKMPKGALITRTSLGKDFFENDAHNISDMVFKANQYAYSVFKASADPKTATVASMQTDLFGHFMNSLRLQIKSAMHMDPQFKANCEKLLSYLAKSGITDPSKKKVFDGVLVDTGYKTLLPFTKALLEVKYGKRVNVDISYYWVAPGYEYLPHVGVAGDDVDMIETCGDQRSFIKGAKDYYNVETHDPLSVFNSFVYMLLLKERALRKP